MIINDYITKLFTVYYISLLMFNIACISICDYHNHIIFCLCYITLYTKCILVLSYWLIYISIFIEEKVLKIP